ncbi:MAG: preprotein translocase subunit SecE [Candidatus Bipolaricaulota bacterium]|jgi:preprotein translocase subunit SecE|nr:preprotein translocase subunit SecE [Candidatus Bipolaricaulota bacterium]
MFERVKNYLSGVRSEVARVSWPTRKEIISLTALILLLIVVMTIYIWGVDTVVQGIMRLIIQR